MTSCDYFWNVFPSYRIPLMDTTRFVVMKTATSAAVDSLNTCPTLGQSTLHRSCPPPVLYTVSMAPSLVYMTSPNDTQPPQQEELHMNSSKLPNSNLLSQLAFILLILFTAALLTYPLLMVAPLPAMLSLHPTKRWTRTTNQIRPARCPVHPASLMPPHKCPPSSLTTAGPHNACRLTSD